MKKYPFIVILSAFLFSNQSALEAKSKLTPQIIEHRIDSILKKMTLEEKVGQMAQYTMDVLGKGGGLYNSDEPLQIDDEMLNVLIGKYKVGSILNTANNRARTPQVWEQVIKAIQEKSMKEIGIPLIYGIDAIHGATYTANSTFFPQQIGMAATFNPALMEKGSQITAYETRASNTPWVFSPVLDLGRDARWPRQWETYGEDTYLAKVMGLASVNGFQGNDKNNIDDNHVAVSLKHFMGYGVPVSGKDRTPAIISASDLREKHFETFRAAIKAGALTIMVNSGMVNGVNGHANYEFLTKWLKEDLEFDGMIVTDWADVQNLYSRDHIAINYKDAIKQTINAGVDMVMEPYNLQFCDSLIYLAKNGEVSQDRIDDAVKRVLRLKIRLGLFENPYWSNTNYADFAGKEHQKVATSAAEESITLLKNTNNILPLKKGAKILVAGPNANSMRTLNGGWSYSWQGEKVDEFAANYNTFYEAIQNKFGKANVKYSTGVEYNMTGKYFEEKTPAIQKAVLAATAVDYIVLCLGENSYCETPGNLEELTLSDNQIALAKALQKTGKPVIIVLNEGRPRLIRTIEPNSKAIIQTYLPGNFGADALANILSGEVSPSGKLPYTYPKYEQSIITYDHKPCQNLDGKMEGMYDYGAQTSVQYPFGFGLSYTSFEYSNLVVDKKQFVSGDEINVSVEVKNTGKVLGKETIMLFTSDLVASITPDVRRLRAFDKISLKPGETKTVKLKLLADDLSFVNEKGQWILEAGEFQIQIGNLISKINCLSTKKWNTPNK